MGHFLPPVISLCSLPYGFRYTFRQYTVLKLLPLDLLTVQITNAKYCRHWKYEVKTEIGLEGFLFKMIYLPFVFGSWRIADIEQSKLQNCKLEDDQVFEVLVSPQSISMLLKFSVRF